ncbi:putative carboxymethylenebutenolidase [Gordonia effusa NBRC 100432]|uniref:Putative carboxymethylenebutenolidase n=1 Tax=Gordonia effusa NBRC 100432 TaxID=1077974 RepID=H0QUI1_9ACTN|nr:dienelactone hydrolase family protein [Gordonia effusa]GAB16482.1 putative carboxymethylenebutenolidase [Gordonia effusa NBRC 100432]
MVLAAVQIETARGVIDAVVATPDAAVHGPGPYPGVVVLHDITGSGEDLRTHLERVAGWGMVAIGPDLFGSGRQITCIARAMRDLVRRSGPTLDDVTDTARWLREHRDCTGKIGVVGFCLGGGFALLSASQGFEVAAPFYGQIPLGQRQALHEACPVVASFGRRDVTLPAAGRRLSRALDEAEVAHDVVTYPCVGHSFANKIDLGAATPLLRITGFGYDEATAEHAWDRVRSYFAKYLQPDA